MLGWHVGRISMVSMIIFQSKFHLIRILDAEITTELCNHLDGILGRVATLLTHFNQAFTVSRQMHSLISARAPNHPTVASRIAALSVSARSLACLLQRVARAHVRQVPHGESIRSIHM